MTRDVSPRSDIKHCARLRSYFHKRYSSTKSFASEEAHTRDVLSILQYFRKRAPRRRCFPSNFLKIFRTVYLTTLDGQRDLISPKVRLQLSGM